METTTSVKVLGYLRARWEEKIEPLLSQATVGQEEMVRALWEETLDWLKTARGLQGDSLRKPITQLRHLIRSLPLTEENSWEGEHLGLRFFNLSEGEWVRLNDRTRAVTQDRLDQQRLVRDPEGIVQQALSLVLSDDWTDLVVGIAITTGRRLAEIMKTGRFAVKKGYTVWFEGQVKGRTRPVERYEIPTLVRSFLVVDAVEKLRRLMDCRDLEVEQVSQKYSKAVNDAVERLYGDRIEARTDRERLTVHNLRAVYASIAVLWYAPDRVSSVNYKAQIQGHRFLLDPQVEPGTSEDEVEKVRLNYASHANYDDYKIADEEGKLDGRQGIKLGLPGVTVLDAFPDAKKELEATTVKSSGRRTRRKKAEDNQTGYSSYRPTVATRSWGDDLQEQMQRELGGRVMKDDEFLRRIFAGYVAASRGRGHQEESSPRFSLDTLPLSAEQHSILQEGMALSGAPDLFTFLLAAGEREARHLKSQARRHDPDRYASVPTSKLAGMKTPEASQERMRRAVYAIMQWNASHRPLERWYITTLALQKLVGGSKDAIKAYQDAHAQEIEAHHQALEIKPSANRKSEPIEQIVVIPDEPTAYPWGNAPQEG